jgi:Zn-dependent M16 (insulinase) family peptidase
MAKKFFPLKIGHSALKISRRLDKECLKKCEESTPHLKKGIAEILNSYKEEGIDSKYINGDITPDEIKYYEEKVKRFLPR